VSFDTKYEKDSYCAKSGLDQMLFQYVSTKEQAKELLNIIDDLKSNVDYKNDIKASEKELHNADTEEAAANKKLQELILYCEKYDHSNEANILKSILLPQPTAQKRMTPSLQNTELKKKLIQQLKDNGFKNITKLISAINTSIKY